VTDHGVDAPVLRILQLLKDGSIKRLANAEHEALPGMNHRTMADYVVLVTSPRLSG
jgi:hypothetical protein